MAEPSFASAERRSLWLPIALALAALALAAAIAIHFFPATTVNIAQVRNQVLPARVVFGTDTKVVGVQQVERTLFVAETVRIENKLRQPIFLDGFQLTLTDSTGAQLTVPALKPDDLPALALNFPALGSMVAHPLRRELTIPVGQTAEGTLLFSLEVSPELWAARREATVKVSLYHLNPVYQTIPKP